MEPTAVVAVAAAAAAAAAVSVADSLHQSASWKKKNQD